MRDLKSWAELIFKDVKADASNLVEVRVVNLRAEENFRRYHRVLIGQENLESKSPALIDSLLGPLHSHSKVS